MSYHYKSIKVWGRYKTRKDFHHTSKGFFMSYYHKKDYRHFANIKLRRHKGEVGQNGWYKRFTEVMWYAV